VFQRDLFPGRHFDLITVNQVLEHVLDPIGFLKDLRSGLAPGGMIYLEVPHIADIGHLPPTHDRFLMQHLWFFSTASLTNVCRIAGYEPVAVEQELTLRDRNNAVMLMKPAAAGTKVELTREDPAAIRAINRLDVI
jgi:SAM-dependent methyltransferase